MYLYSAVIQTINNMVQAQCNFVIVQKFGEKKYGVLYTSTDWQVDAPSAETSKIKGIKEYFHIVYPKNHLDYLYTYM